MQDRKRAIGILAGGGSLPREIADLAAGRGHAVSIVAIEGEADQEFGPYPVTVANWGQVGLMLRALAAAGAEDLVLVGKVRRPDLTQLRPDLGFFRALAEILGIFASGGDDGVLRAVVRFFENKGLRVIGVAEAAPELVIGEGPVQPLTEAHPPNGSDIAAGFAVIRTLGRHDIGQAVVISGGRVEAIEAAEGTDGMLARVRDRRQAAAGSRCGVLVKRSKPGQELRVDMPAIGPGTVALAAEAGLAGIAVEAGQVIALDRKGLAAEIARTGLFVVGVRDKDGGAGVPEGAFAAPATYVAVGPRPIKAKAREDAVRGAKVLESVTASTGSAGLVVSRGYVLAVEAGEGLAAMLARAGGLRQWGAQRWGRRRGVAVVARGPLVDRDAIAAAAAAGLEGIVVIHDGGADLAELAVAAGRAGLFLAVGTERMAGGAA